jgi:hypothetical protein
MIVLGQKLPKKDYFGVKNSNFWVKYGKNPLILVKKGVFK